MHALCVLCYDMIGYGVYSATKGAIEVLSNTLAQELGGRGITVNTVHPGGTATGMYPSIVSANRASQHHLSL